jgi:hypothetical protein
MNKLRLFCAILALGTAPAFAITIGPGPIIGTNKNPNVTGSAVWYQELQDWSKTDLRALDSNNDQYKFNVASDTARDLVAFYNHDDGTNVYFRLDVFDMLFGNEIGEMDVYVAIDCAAGGQEWLPDFSDTKTDHPWELCIGVYNSGNHSITDSGFNTNYPSDFLGSYWRSDLDGVEFGFKRALLIAKGWNGTSALHFQPFICRDGTHEGAGEIAGQASDIVDALGLVERGTSTSNGWLRGGVLSSATAGRAKYAVIAHANQSVGTKSGTQNHIFTDRSDLDPDLYPGFIRLIDSAEMLNVPINLHISGTLLMSFQWATQNPAAAGYPNRDGPTFLGRVKRFATTGPGSLIGGVLAEHIMPYFEGEVNRKSIAQNSELIQNLFGLSEADMGVMHVPERVFHTNTNSPHVSPNGPIQGKPFADIEASGFDATVLDEVTHLHWWFYPNETNNVGWDDNNSGRWAGGRGNDEEPYHHKVHKINGVYCFIINDREDQEKFGNDDGGMNLGTRYTLLQKALNPDSSQLTLTFDDWEAFAGNSFASSTPNNNADQWDRTIRWAANHPWIELVNLKTVLGWAKTDPTWTIDQGYVYDKSMQTYEWLKRASEHTYDHWYYGSGLEEGFFDRKPLVHDGWTPAGMKKYGDLNTTNTLIRDSWDQIQQIASPNLRQLAEWSYSAMIYETAWHDEDANPDQYKSRNYQVTFNRTTAQGNADDSFEDVTFDQTSGWAVRLHGHVRDMGVLKAADTWVQNVRNGTQSRTTTVYAADIDDDTLNEYVLCNDKVFLCFEGWGARLVKAFSYAPNVHGGDALAVIGVPIANPAEESENEGADNNRCSAFKDRYCTGKTNAYVDMDSFLVAAPTAGSNSWTFRSADSNLVKKITLPSGRDVVSAEYAMQAGVGTMYSRYGLGPNQFDLMMHGPSNLAARSDASFRGLKNAQGGEAYVVAGRNMAFINGTIANAGWDNRELPLVQQYETASSSTNWSVGMAFSEASARDLDGDGIGNTNETALGTDHEKWDTDGDAMPDGYEVANSLDPQVQDGGLDKDEDGAFNYEEYVANTLANNSNSLFYVASISATTASNVLVHPVATQRLYTVLFADNLTGGQWDWQSFSNPAQGTWLETDPAATTHAFVDDFGSNTSGARPDNGNGLRVYAIRVSVP